MAGKYLRSRRTQNLLRFLDVAGKRRFPRSKLGKAGILQLAGEKKRDDFGLLHRRLFEIEPFFGVLRFSLQCTNTGFLLIQKERRFPPAHFPAFSGA